MLAGCLDLESENVVKLQSETSARLRTLKLDVTSSEDLQNARDWINNNLEDRCEYILKIKFYCKILVNYLRPGL